MRRAGLLILGLLVIGGVVYLARAMAPSQLDLGLDALGFALEPTGAGVRDATLAVGLLLLGSWLFGRLVASISLPKISGYLVFGAVVGPSALSLVTKDQLVQLGLINDLAIALIALTAGGEIRLSVVKRAAKTLTLVTLLVVGLTALAVGALMFFLMERLGVGWLDNTAQRLALATVIGAVVAASSPAAVIAVIAETRARGRMTQLSLSTAVCIDVAIIVLFALVVGFAGPALRAAERAATDDGGAAVTSVESKDDAGEAAGAPLPEGDERAPDAGPSIATVIVVELGGSALVGAVLGMALAWCVPAVKGQLPIFVVLVCFGISLLSRAAHLDALIVALSAGLMMENLWKDRSGALFETLEELSLPVFCVFFAVAGAKIDIGTIAQLWPAVLLVAVVRAGTIWAGTHVGLRLSNEGGKPARWLWVAFVPQAGIALALASLVQRSFEDLPIVDNVFALIVSVIAINELAGPVLLKLGLARAGEVDGGSGASEGEDDGAAPAPH